jgi:glycine hydroxymethyltransferase
VLHNIKAIAKKLLDNGYKLVSGGTDNHLILVDMRSRGLDGARMELLTNELCIYINKNTVPGDKSALVPSGIRIGSPAMTTRGLREKDFETIYEFTNRVTEICKCIK